MRPVRIVSNDAVQCRSIMWCLPAQRRRHDRRRRPLPTDDPDGRSILNLIEFARHKAVLLQKLVHHRQKQSQDAIDILPSAGK